MKIQTHFALGASIALATAAPACAQHASELRIAQQFGIAYLPLIVVNQQKLVERFAREAGLGDISVRWERFSGGSAMNDALIAGSLDIAAAGVPPMIVLWDRTRGNLKVRGVAALGSMPNFLNTNNPAVRTLKDFGAQDRIALPAIKVGFQPVVLQMAAEQQFGAGNAQKLDPLTVSMPHPDAAVALLAGSGTITAHFTSPPFLNQELKDAKIHKVLSSYDVLGGPHTFNVLYATSRFRDANPVLLAAFVKALDAADAFIAENPKAASAAYLASEKSPLSAAEIEAIIRDPENRFTVTPENTMKFADFQARTGQIKERPAGWRDLFFPELHDRKGS